MKILLMISLIVSCLAVGFSFGFLIIQTIKYFNGELSEDYIQEEEVKLISSDPGDEIEHI